MTYATATEACFVECPESATLAPSVTNDGETPKPEKPKPAKPMQWAAFLRSHPTDGPAVAVIGGVLTTRTVTPPQRGYGTTVEYSFEILQGPIVLHCDSPLCGGDRLFDRKPGSVEISADLTPSRAFFVRYVCRHCQVTFALFAVLLSPADPNSEDAKQRVQVAVKLGQWPSFGEKVPDKAVDLIAPNGSEDRALFFQGRKAENRGLGIGALTYYRRVLANQKGRIVEEILEVAKALNASTDVIEGLEWARTAWRFQDAVDRIKGAIPEALKIDGHNPLVLLHDALSQGIHDLSDAECLQRAQDIRTVLTELAARIELAMRDKHELRGAVQRLLAKKATDPKDTA